MSVALSRMRLDRKDHPRDTGDWVLGWGLEGPRLSQSEELGCSGIGTLGLVCLARFGGMASMTLTNSPEVTGFSRLVQASKGGESHARSTA
jgi:hypothetical protein